MRCIRYLYDAVGLILEKMMMCKTKIISSLKESKAAFFYSYGTENLLFFDATLSSVPSFTGSVLMANDFQGCLIYNLAEKEKKNSRLKKPAWNN